VVAAWILAALVAQTTTYRIDSAAAEAGFALKATLHTVHGTTAGVTGEVRVEPADAGALNLSGKIEIDASSLATGNEKRDATMHGTSLLVPSYPAIVFVPERFVPGGPPDAGGGVAGALTVRLTIRGQTRSCAMAATFAPKAGRIVATGAFDVVWADFGIPDPSFLFVRIDKSAHAHFHAEFVPVP
jgi:polyisoprenoid-binding protein YceI